MLSAQPRLSPGTHECLVCAHISRMAEQDARSDRLRCGPIRGGGHPSSAAAVRADGNYAVATGCPVVLVPVARRRVAYSTRLVNLLRRFNDVCITPNAKCLQRR